MKKCSACGYVNDDENEYCYNCKTKLPIGDQVVAESTKKSLSKSTLILLIITIAIIVGFFLLWLLAAGAASGLSD
jgi:uncharacterized membrane protein YvbJ